MNNTYRIGFWKDKKYNISRSRSRRVKTKNFERSKWPNSEEILDRKVKNNYTSV